MAWNSTIEWVRKEYKLRTMREYRIHRYISSFRLMATPLARQVMMNEFIRASKQRRGQRRKKSPEKIEGNQEWRNLGT